MTCKNFVKINNSTHIYQLYCTGKKKVCKNNQGQNNRCKGFLLYRYSIDTLNYLPDVNAVPLAAPNVERVTAKGMRKAAQPNTRFPKV